MKIKSVLILVAIAIVAGAQNPPSPPRKLNPENPKEAFQIILNVAFQTKLDFPENEVFRKAILTVGKTLDANEKKDNTQEIKTQPKTDAIKVEKE